MASINIDNLDMPSAKDLMRGYRAPKQPKFTEVSVPSQQELEKETKEFLKDFERDLERTEDESNTEPKIITDQLAYLVRQRFDESSSARSDLERRWLQDLRQYRGQYPAEMLERMDPNRSRAFIRLTRTKVKTVDSRLTDFLFPANGDQNWNIEPTPIPDYKQEDAGMVLQQALVESGQQMTLEEFEQKLLTDARSKAQRMSKTIEDQLSEIRYRDVMRAVLHSGNLYGTGILKGPMVNFVVNKQYRQVKSSSGAKRWKMESFDKITPYAESVSIWDIYPDLSATDLNECMYIVQRHKMGKHKLVDIARRSDFRGKHIREYLKDNPNGDYERKWFETELRSMGDVGAQAEQVEPNKSYEVLEHWGFVDAEDLTHAGICIPDHMKGSLELMANIWVLGDRVIKATLAPLEGVSWPYFFYYYDKDETSIFGEGIPAIMRDPQELVNTAFRAMLDHAAITAGPQIEVNLDLLSEDEDPTDVRPFKAWMRTGTGMEAAAEAVRVIQLPSHTGEYLGMIEAFERYSDEVTTIPRYMWGDQAGGAGRTASGLSMMMGSANITIKDQVKNFDDGITKPFIGAMYHWNMQFNPDETIKGDYNINASGTTSLVAREVYSNSLMNFANITNNPVDLPLTKRDKIIRSIADSLDLGDKDLVLSDREITLNNQQAAQQAKEERQFMLRMVDAAREHGISPNDMIENMRIIRQDMTQPQQPEVQQ